MTCTIPIDVQLRQLAALETGWHDGDGVPISTLTLMEAGRRLREHMASVGVLPFIYPCTDGGILVEWDDNEGGHFKIAPIEPLLTREEFAHVMAQLRAEDDE